MAETRKLAAILAADVVEYSRLAGADEDRILPRLGALRSDLIDPTVAVHRGRVVKRTGDGAIVEFRSVVDAVRCATEIQNAMIERNSGLPDGKRIVFRIGIQGGSSGAQEQRLAKPGGGQRDLALRMCPQLGIEIFAPNGENGPGRASIQSLKDR
jgi:class 3 adenylate cyclase